MATVPLNIFLSFCLRLQGSGWKRSMAEPQLQLGESHSLTPARLLRDGACSQ